VGTSPTIEFGVLVAVRAKLRRQSGQDIGHIGEVTDPNGKDDSTSGGAATVVELETVPLYLTFDGNNSAQIDVGYEALLES
jgi:hypothetical protein